MNTTSTGDHERYMRRCLELARIARDRKNTPVGSIVVIDGEIVGDGIEALLAGTNVTGHAEVLACQAAVDKTGSRLLTGASLYSTAEPCFMCSYVIRQRGISLVVYGLETPDVGGITSSHPILTDPGLTDWKASAARCGRRAAGRVRAASIDVSEPRLWRLLTGRFHGLALTALSYAPTGQPSS